MKRKGFTLIELLAVIVTLAIVAVIATPIIARIIEDSRKAAFERSVEGIIHATDIDFGTLGILENYEYTITDGVVDKTLKTPIKNIEGFYGIIKYDEKNNKEYAIHNDKWCMIKKNSEIITIDYEEETCLLEESPDKVIETIATTITNLVPNANDIVTSGEGQLINLGEYGIRYQGANPNNYVEFSGETWRIIGIVDEKIKLIRATSLDDKLAWNDQNGNGRYDSSTDKNNWSNATLQNRLNTVYYESLIDKDMIDPSTWYLIGYNSASGIDKYEMYGIERGTGSIAGVTLYDTPSIERNIGLMYPSDYGFAAQITSTCTDTKALYNYESCKTTNWLLKTQTDNYEWTIMPRTGSENSAFYIDSSGSVGCSSYVSNSVGVRPTIYLKPTVKIVGDGDGSEKNKYQLSL